MAETADLNTATSHTTTTKGNNNDELTTNATPDVETAGGDNDGDKWEVTRKRGR